MIIFLMPAEVSVDQFWAVWDRLAMYRQGLLAV